MDAATIIALVASAAACVSALVAFLAIILANRQARLARESAEKTALAQVRQDRRLELLDRTRRDVEESVGGFVGWIPSAEPAAKRRCNIRTPSAPGNSRELPGFPGPADTARAGTVTVTAQGFEPSVQPLDPTEFTARTRYQ